jgi:hypothetical protein
MATFEFRFSDFVFRFDPLTLGGREVRAIDLNRHSASG